MSDGHFEFLVDWSEPSPSARDGVPAADEATLRAYGCASVAATCVLLEVPQAVSATGKNIHNNLLLFCLQNTNLLLFCCCCCFVFDLCCFCVVFVLLLLLLLLLLLFFNAIKCSQFNSF